MARRTGKIISSFEGHTSNKQHQTPCSDCPMRRDAVPGWLGGYTPEEYKFIAHSPAKVMCHVITNQQCAGMAIYRRNVVQRVDPGVLTLPKDEEKVLSFEHPFLDHHKDKKSFFNK